MAEAKLLGFAEALAAVVERATAVLAPKLERVGLLESAGRVLGQDVRSDRDQPPFDRSTRDGFAVRAGEYSRAGKLRVVGQVRAGEVWEGGALGSGDAVEIMTGAAVPTGMDAVAMVEHVELAEGVVWASAGRVLRAGENVVPRGSEALAGDVVLAVGKVMGSAEIAVAASCGCSDLMVRMRPEVGFVATGDELVELKE